MATVQKKACLPKEEENVLLGRTQKSYFPTSQIPSPINCLLLKSYLGNSSI